MRTLKGIMREKLVDPDFKCLYDEECHTCRVTVEICAALQERGLTSETLAAELKEDPATIAELFDGDKCDAKLVCRIASYLGISPPENCPREQS